MIFRESNLKSLVPHTQFQVDFFKTFDRNAIRTVTAPTAVQAEETTTETVEETEEKE